jgi:hypothetical protein
MIRRSLRPRPSRRCAKDYDKWIGMTSRQMNLPQDREETVGRGDGGTGRHKEQTDYTVNKVAWRFFSTSVESSGTIF